jgi:Zn-dependent M28 family amino/carboxypeptidase
MNRTEIRGQLAAHLNHLSIAIGERSIYHPQNLKAAEDYIYQAFSGMGYASCRQSFIYQRREVSNIVAGASPVDGYYILGAHYDTVPGTPGADDNASGVAVLLEVARLARGLSLPRPWAFIAFTTEEHPASFTPYMGSRVYARGARERRENILGMLCLESVGYYSRSPGSQSLPLALRFLGYPTTGNFIGLVGDRRSRSLLRGLNAALQQGCLLSTATLIAPLGGRLQPEVRLSDHSSFWDEGYPAVMLTDTAFMRNPNYHGPQDVMASLDLEAMTELVLGLLHFLPQAGL